ncbi:MAG: hypothetical protein IKV29_05520 [Alistipes sp.]|nr:hypothetical protein [Alistipes sp.]
MRGFVSNILALLSALLILSCGGGGSHSVEMHDRVGSLWLDAEEFTYENSDTLYRRNISINVRYDGDYVADSVPLKILTISPDSMVLEEDFTLHIPHLADMRPEEHTFVYRSNVLLKRSGEYRFRLTPLEPIDGIASVGLIVDERPTLNE